MFVKIAFRNILRNGRRSLMTLLAIAVGGISMVLFGEFVGFVRASLETNAVQNVGHLTVYRKGFFDYGAGNPAAFGIDDYGGVMRLIAGDPVIAPAVVPSSRFNASFTLFILLCDETAATPAEVAMTATKLVPIASFTSSWNKIVSAGTRKIPPPIPSNAPNKPATTPTINRRIRTNILCGCYFCWI